MSYSRPLLLFCLLLFGLSSVASAQSYSASSGRNHPELSWQVAETKHFRIMYPARLAGIEAVAAPIAEESYDVLAANLGVSFDEKIRIYLSDEDAIVNGFAVPIGDGYTQIWVHQNSGAQVWTGEEKWLRKVIAHELAHIFHYRAVASPWGLIGSAFGESLPRFWTEGLAQYQTEAWDAQRGDRWLRTAVLDDALNYRDGHSAWNGRLLYALGNSQVRYFATQYGDSTLTNLLEHQKPVLLGLTTAHDFETAFKATTGTTYRSFYDDWRRAVNVYYNTLAGQLEPLEALGSDPLPLDGQYLYDAAYAPDTSVVATVMLPSLSRPVRRLVVRDTSGQRRILAEGSIGTPIAWHPDGSRLAFTRTGRGTYGALVPDLYLVHQESGRQERLTTSRRASLPTFSPAGDRLAFVVTTAGTANVVIRHLDTEEETNVTAFTGDVQIESIAWRPESEQLALALFEADGTRRLHLLDLTDASLTPLTNGVHDDRGPVWSPDGTALGYTSLRDDVPNAFVLDMATRRHRRVTHLALGATLHDWLPPDSTHAQGRLLLVSNAAKTGDRAYLVDATRTTPTRTPAVPEAYTGWLTHRPPATLPAQIAPDSSLITSRYRYRPLREITHVVTLPLPYISSEDDWGLSLLSFMLEPLGKHQLYVAGNVSFPTPLTKSYGLLTYVNNQLRPTTTLNLYRLNDTNRIYGDILLNERVTGGDLRLSWPLDWFNIPYESTTLSGRVRYVDVVPRNSDEFEPLDDLLPPEQGQQADLQLQLLHRKQRPYRYNTVHPLDAYGLRLQVTGAARLLGGDQSFLRGDVAAWRLLPTFGTHRLYLYGRAQAQRGSSFAQDYVGFSRYDDVNVFVPALLPIDLQLGDADRVRGYRRYALGNRLLFGSAEYRVLLLPDLQTRLLGVVALGGTAVSPFLDMGMVWNAGARDAAERRTGVGIELKNALRFFGAIEIAHAVGIGQPLERVGTDADYDLYYRLRAAVPF